jgi:glycosyltransferase involved in cell wall biosynthesis
LRVLHVGYGFRPFHEGGLVAYAEDLMAAQVARGHEVTYFFAGRPALPPGPRVRSWSRGGVRMLELRNSPVVVTPADRGTRRPDLDLDAPSVERLFREAIATARPDVVHVHDLGRIPSSVLDIPHETGTPVLMTLQDYFPLCPTLKLYDADGLNCRRLDPAPMCARCCRDAAHGGSDVMTLLRDAKRRAARRWPAVDRVPGPRAVGPALRSLRGSPAAAAEPGAPAESPPVPDVEGFRARRAENLRRLGRADRLIAMSRRVADIYTELGVDPARLITMELTLGHIAGIRPRALDAVRPPIRFVTLTGCVSPQKGSRVVAGALGLLAERGLTPADLELSIAGHVDPAVARELDASPLTRVVGGYSSADVDALLDGHHVGIVPPIWEEAYGYVGIELLAKGIPVIGNAIGGIPEYTRDGETGWLNAGCDADGLAEIMAGIVERPEQVTRLNATIRERRAELVKPMPAHAGEVDAVYAELAPQSSSTAFSVGK